MKYLLKQCGGQELGSRKRRNSRPARGQYLYISKEARDLFPTLSSTIINDFSLVPFLPLYYQGHRVWCRFSYHNSKFATSKSKGGKTGSRENGRNELRTYLKLSLQGGKRLFWKGGILVMRLVDDNDTSCGFYLDYADDKFQPERYKTYKKLLKHNLIPTKSGRYGIVDGNISFFEEQVALVSELTLDDYAVDLSPDIVKAAAEPGDKEEFTQQMFRDFLVKLYTNCCVVSRTSISKDHLCNVQAAHIRPRKYKGSTHPTNGILLSRDLHWAFDLGFFTLTDDFRVQVSKKINCPELSAFDTREILLPKNKKFWPKLDNIRYHRRHVFEKFKPIRGEHN